MNVKGENVDYKQRMIVRQSSLKASVDLFCNKLLVSTEEELPQDVIAVAQIFEEWVINESYRVQARKVLRSAGVSELPE